MCHMSIHSSRNFSSWTLGLSAVFAPTIRRKPHSGNKASDESTTNHYDPVRMAKIKTDGTRF